MKKIALVTGGNSGIGYATAKLLKEKGYEVFISGRDPDRVKQAADTLGVNSIVADMTDPEKIRMLASQFLESGLDVLVNNAGIPKNFSISNLTVDDFSEIFNTNVRGPLLLIKELLPALDKRHGSITTVSSAITEMGKPNLFLYAATKGAVNAFTRSLAIELAPQKIRVNAVAPGITETSIFTKAGMNPEEIAEFKKILEADIPMGSLGRPEEIAQVIVAQVESTYVTGAVWNVDGGVSAV
jgi:NAD(P)-dependent dehydrogenase (short-subunit alcohol dehydrogenase family)